MDKTRRRRESTVPPTSIVSRLRAQRIEESVNQNVYSKNITQNE
jgi:hypothetical protein